MYPSGPTVRVARPPSYPYLKAEPLLAVQEVMWSLPSCVDRWSEARS